MPSLEAGPVLQGAWPDRLNVWFALDGPGSASVRIGGQQVSADVETDHHTGLVSFQGLQPETSYEYELLVDGQVASGPWQTMTMPAPGSPSRFVLFVANDRHRANIYAYDRALVALDRFLGNTPILALSVGDWELIDDSLMDSYSDRIERLILLRRHSGPGGLNPEKAEFLSRLPMVATWDDWDSWGNNCSKAGPNAPDRPAIARQVWRDTWQGMNPPANESDGIYRSFVVGEVFFLLLDNRTHRDGCPRSIPPVSVADGYDYQNARVWGDTQLDWMKAQLLANANAPFKVVGHGCDFMDHVRGGVEFGASWRDSMGIYLRRDRNDLLSWLKDNRDCARGMVWLTGDSHIQAVRYTDKFRDPEPLDGPAAADSEPDPSTPQRRYVPILEVKQCWPSGAILATEWYGAESERFLKPDNAFGLNTFNTELDQPKATCRWISSFGPEIYRCWIVDGVPYIPSTTLRSNADGPIEQTFNEQSPAATSWTPRPDPA